MSESTQSGVDGPAIQVRQQLSAVLARRGRGKAKLLGIGLFVVIAAAAGAWLVVNTKPIPAKYRQSLTFPLYYPKSLPNGYAVDRTSFANPQKGIVEFSITAPGGKNVAVSEEHMPADLDLSKHASPTGVQLPDQDNFTTAVGTAQTSFWGGKFVCSVVTQNTWIILNVSGFTNKQAELVAQSFEQI